MRTTAPFVTLCLVAHASTTQADPLIDVVDRGAARVVLDGVLREWQGNLVGLDDRAQLTRGANAWSGPDDASVGFCVARDEEALYLVAEVRDDQVIRTRAHRPGEDALVLTIAFPNGRLWTAWELAVMPGEPGSFAGAVQYRVPRLRALPGAQVVEAPFANGSGFTVEARIPFASLPGLRDNLGSARMRLAYDDADRGGASTLASGTGDVRRPQDLPPTVAASAAVAAQSVDQLARFQREHSVTGTPVFDRSADAMGTSVPERVVAFPRHLLAFGRDIAGGTSYTFLEFPTGQITGAMMRDVTGDRRADVVVNLRVPGGPFDRELVHVYTLDATGSFQRAFVRETARAQGERRVANTPAWAGSSVTFAVTESRGFDATTWPASVEAGVDAPVTPWGPHRTQRYRWDDTARSFVLERSEPNAAAARAAAPVVAAPTPADGPDEPTDNGPDVAGVLSLFRQREHLAPDARPTHRATGDAAEDATPEQFFVFGRSLVLVGPRYQGGRAYASIGLAMGEGDEVVSLRAADITDDGKVEAIVTVRRAVTVQVRGAPLTSRRDMVFAYSFDAAHRGRVFAAEIARRVGSDSVVNRVVLPRGGRGSEIAVETAGAAGWTRETYPFHDGPAQGFEALVLPWEGVRRVTWRWTGTGFARTP
jgi:hypothetical protein